MLEVCLVTVPPIDARSTTRSSAAFPSHPHFTDENVTAVVT